MRNMHAMSERLKSHGIELVSGGTDNHLVLADLRPLGVDGSRVERVLELAHIACNKNTVPGDKSAMVPGGLRLGTPALTTRGFVEADFETVADFVVRGIHIAKDLKAKVGPKLKDFREGLADAPKGKFPEIDALKSEVEAFAAQFPTIGFDKAEGKYTQAL
jgi:glycine hydroxymethyltransferase